MMGKSSVAYVISRHTIKKTGGVGKYEVNFLPINLNRVLRPRVSLYPPENYTSQAKLEKCQAAPQEIYETPGVSFLQSIWIQKKTTTTTATTTTTTTTLSYWPWAIVTIKNSKKQQQLQQQQQTKARKDAFCYGIRPSSQHTAEVHVPTKF